MTRRFIGVRWWLGVAFALVAAVSTALVVSQFSSQSQNAFRDRAQELALGSTSAAAKDLAAAAGRGKLGTSLPAIARRQDLALRLYDAHGVRIGSASPRSGPISEPKLERDALLVALRGGKYRASTGDGRVFVAAVPLHASGLGALVAL